MVSETADVADEVAPAPKRDRWVERTVDLDEPEIAAIEAAEMTPAVQPCHISPESPAHA